ncbi:hypothetical protein JQU17_20190 [Ponticoccus sp. SC2-23]|uniref:hypothetical protein n=1 Tax=Alexandriicola marinus TaxID=2081710 RepID=UPI000FD96672|nr:hypothetical protein [Alexandriicola marinus]MBM1222537.1 hypothetical protein [Ponticoccus sp. SC6-9]MBM1227042.1 hypothetical protein [Ponticoccus sp. SC6-15]MBM1231463.1 hypothetical protein [Ponticoccus sp. SC6-38]MBM1236101.1 hypothetical protein [Ponticoccus sp. SC6-45]MBM1240486.1 hypothetical protein [Ponticoccus sp. SC6-49]MBM1245021.1 hypothetical protein [Ponticoccus sp. SC2-64]MBM1249575.1 hypothetical protein [Ponticoccus sp. SC6-42]MBM1253979.1 hypothetical protein [Pontico
MTTTAKLNLVKSDGRPQTNSITTKRNRLIAGLQKQLSELELHAAGHWSPRMWFWQVEDGSYRLEVRYAKKPLELSKDKTAIACDDEDALRTTIDELVAMVRAGEFDDKIEERSAMIRQRFGK